ncbi:hypothetical protein CLV37_10911 [Kineococcus rhizosphaerae]|uniref:DUF1345 domain-containing protein n=1 Tax=Kineococcus rhizosphaerae TaxID=559628 RepID=A0A2T0R0K8_9ACTN|nr:hypothetical protein CLV37_10911 [Kineococcus rhizosphaerae]
MATAVAIALYAVLPEKLIPGPRLAVPVLEVLLLVAVVVANPVRSGPRTRWSRRTSIALTVLVLATNLYALTVLLHALVATKAGGPPLLLAALQIWVTNVIVFGLLFWELDRGGPVARQQTRRDRLQAADFRFTQDEDDDTVEEVRRGSSAVSGWIPGYVDHLYVSLTNSSAFSPTDTMPLTPRAKVLMGFEATTALITSVVVIAKGVGSLQ